MCDEFLGLACAFKLCEEPHVVLAEHAEVFHTIFEVGDALYAHAESIAGIDLRINATGFEHVGIYHAAAEDLHPTGAFAESTTFAAADMAADIHLG